MNAETKRKTQATSAACAGVCAESPVRKSMKAIFVSVLAFLAAAGSASAITVVTPYSGAEVSSPFTLIASSASCASKPTVSMGYSIDHGKATIVSRSFTAMVLASEGPHVLHVKCWGVQVHDEQLINITVVPETAFNVPANVTAVTNIQSLPTWQWEHDPGTPGESSGASQVMASPSMTGNARQFSVTFSGSGGEIYHDAFGTDVNATHFIYDAYVMLTQSSSLANVEMDMNQVMPNGLTVIYGFQCSSYSGTWEYSYNVGTPQNPKVQWFRSNATCPLPSTWETNVWHHVQVAYSRDNNGVVTYEAVALDGEQQDLVNAKGNSSFDLKWKPVLATNFQLDGRGSEGALTAYLDKVTVYRW